MYGSPEVSAVSQRHLREILVLSPSLPPSLPPIHASALLSSFLPSRAGKVQSFIENSENSTLEMLSQPDSLAHALQA